MAVTLSVAEFIQDARIGQTPEELALATRRVGYATEVVLRYAPNAPDVAHNEAVSRLAAYLYDSPTTAGRGGVCERSTELWCVQYPATVSDSRPWLRRINSRSKRRRWERGQSCCGGVLLRDYPTSDLRRPDGGILYHRGRWRWWRPKRRPMGGCLPKKWQ